jgi:hypothetical protein
MSKEGPLQIDFDVNMLKKGHLIYDLRVGLSTEGQDIVIQSFPGEHRPWVTIGSAGQFGSFTLSGSYRSVSGIILNGRWVSDVDFDNL